MQLQFKPIWVWLFECRNTALVSGGWMLDIMVLMSCKQSTSNNEHSSTPLNWGNAATIEKYCIQTEMSLRMDQNRWYTGMRIVWWNAFTNFGVCFYSTVRYARRIAIFVVDHRSFLQVCHTNQSQIVWYVSKLEPWIFRQWVKNTSSENKQLRSEIGNDRTSSSAILTDGVT